MGDRLLFVVISIVLWGLWMTLVGLSIYIAIVESLIGGIALGFLSSILIIPVWIWMLETKDY